MIEVSNAVLRAIDVIDAIDEDSCALLFLDISLAFFTADHCLLTEITEQRCGLSGSALKWYTNYLSGRSQSVVIGDVMSSSPPLHFVVSKGFFPSPCTVPCLHLIDRLRCCSSHSCRESLVLGRPSADSSRKLPVPLMAPGK